MAVDTPARIAILGAGPIGLEAALYARFLGYDVDLYERGAAAANLLCWGHVRLFSPFAMNRSPLGLAALAAQDPNWRPPPDDALLNGRELAEVYYLPLAHSDLLADGLHERTEVVAVGRAGMLKGEYVGDEIRIDADFRLLLRAQSEAGGAAAERTATADVVIDATGVYGNHNWLGDGGIPAIGEMAAAAQIEYGLPDILGRDRAQYAHQHTLVVGDGYSAATTVVALDQLARQAPYTSATWITRGPNPSPAGPVQLIADDRLAERNRIAQAANRLATGADHHVRHLPATTIESIAYQADPRSFAVKLAGQHAGEIQVQRIVANVGYRLDNRLYSELHLHERYANSGPETLLQPEPDFYIVGAKSYGRNSQFLISTGLDQIRQLFTIIGDRPDLNLYAGAQAGVAQAKG